MWRCSDPKRLPELRGKLTPRLAERGAAFHAPPRAEQGDRDYSVRWWVDGHWRRYHCGPG
ncbi:hypothetical protein [Actinomadura sp. SCN-SB]|uniref:hypothetical protein n=1 Tax=Actinomadura sp. SCN-SB TaxID=3373092 RepID=UPI003750277C